MAIVTDKSLRWSAWCHYCDIGFDNLEEAHVHDGLFRAKHQDINMMRQAAKAEQEKLKKETEKQS